jgi:hypothetical protein
MKWMSIFWRLTGLGKGKEGQGDKQKGNAGRVMKVKKDL